MADQTLSVKILGDSTSLVSAVDKAQQKLDGMKKDLANTSGFDALGKKLQDIGGKMEAVGKKLTTCVTLPLAAAGTKAVKSFADVDKTMTLTNATMGNTAEQAELLDKAMKEAAANSTFGMSDAATATLNFARAGLDAEQAASALAPAMNLAAGEGGNLDTVSQGLVATINGFGDSFDQAGNYADVFANACNNSALDIDSLSSSMSIAAPIFAAAGYKINDAALYMGVMANAGIDANVAANALKTGMARLVEPSKQGAEWMDKLGISITNADGTMKDSVTVQRELHDAFAGLSESEQIAAASAIFGKNQMSNWLALINTAPDEVDELSAALDQQGTVAKMAEAMMSGFGGSLEKLKSSIDVAATSFGEALAPSVTKVMEKIQSLVDWFNSLDKSQQQTVAKIAALVAAAGPALLVGGKAAKTIGGLMTKFGGLTQMFGSFGGIAGLVIAAFVALYTGSENFRNAVNGLVGTALESLKQIFEAIKPTIEAILPVLKQVIEAIGTSMAPMIKVLTAALKILTPILSFIIQVNGEIVQAVAPVIEKVAELATILHGAVSEALDWVGDKLSKVGEWFTNLAEKSEESSERQQQALAEQKEKSAQEWAEMKQNISATWDAVKTKTSETWDNIKAKMSSAWDSVKAKTSAAGTAISTVWTNLKAKASSIWDGIKTAMVSKITAAKDTVKGILDKLKSFFPISVGKILSNVKLPHFSISGKFSLDPPSIPRVSVSWWAKGGIFNAPSVIGVGEGKEPEAVTPISKLQAYVTEAVTTAGTAPTSAGMDSLVDAIASGFAMMSTPTGGGEYRFTVDLGGVRVAEQVYKLNKQGQMIMEG